MAVKGLETHVANLTTQLATLTTSIQVLIQEHQDQRLTNEMILQTLQTLMTTIQGKTLRIYFPKFTGDDPAGWSKFGTTTSFAFSKIPSDLGINIDEANVLVKESILKTYETNGGCSNSSGLAKATVQGSYSVNKRKCDHLRFPFPQSTASFYNENSPQLEIVESCDSINGLNLYLKARRDDIITVSQEGSSTL